MQTNLRVLYFVLLLLGSKLLAAQSSLDHAISASVGVSFPVGDFAKDVSGEGHGFADPGLAVEIFYNIGHDEKRLHYLLGIIAMTSPLDGEALCALWSPNATIESKPYNLFGISGGAVLDLKESERFIWQLRGTLGVGTISYPAHEMRENFGNWPSRLIYKSSAENNISLNGSLGLAAHYKIASKLQIGCHLDYFRSRAHHTVIYVSETIPPTSEQDVKNKDCFG